MNKQLTTNAEQNLNIIYASYQILNFALCKKKQDNLLYCKCSETKVYKQKTSDERRTSIAN